MQLIIRIMGGSSVRSFRLNEPFNLVVSLFIRDAYRIPAGAGIPQLSPPVPAIPAATDVTPDVARQWQEWWDELLAYEGARRASAGPVMPRGTRPRPKVDETRYPELSVLAREAWDSAMSYADQRAREAADLFREMGPASSGAVEREFLVRRRILKFRHQQADVGVTVIPVGGALAMPQSRCHLLLSRLSYTDRTAYRTALGSMLL